jgi:hypothetical protein
VHQVTWLDLPVNTRASLQVDVKPNVGAAAATMAGDKKRHRGLRAAAREQAKQFIINQSIENSDSDDYEMELECEEDLEEMNKGAQGDHSFIGKIRELLLIFIPCLEVTERVTKHTLHTASTIIRRPALVHLGS